MHKHSRINIPANNWVVINASYLNPKLLAQQINNFTWKAAHTAKVEAERMIQPALPIK